MQRQVGAQSVGQGSFELDGNAAKLGAAGENLLLGLMPKVADRVLRENAKLKVVRVVGEEKAALTAREKRARRGDGDFPRCERKKCLNCVFPIWRLGGH
jgi:hypothetical protein